MAFIYGLLDPRTGELGYVGKTVKSLSWRLKSHLTPTALKQKTHKACWLRCLVGLGLTPEIFLIEQVADEDVDEAEVFWIAYFRSIGAELCNHTPGGDGNRKGTKFSLAARQSQSAGQLRRYERERAAGIKRKMPRDIVDRIAAKRRGTKVSNETRAKLSAERIRRYSRPEARQAQSERMLKSWVGRVPQLVDDQGVVYTSQSDAARKFGVDVSYVYKILKTPGRKIRGRLLRRVEPLPNLPSQGERS